MRKKTVLLFSKIANLEAYSNGLKRHVCEREIEKYAVPRLVNLVLSIGSNERGELMARINCPINPLPVKGEFQIPSPNAIIRWLTMNGWKLDNKLTPRELM